MAPDKRQDCAWFTTLPSLALWLPSPAAWSQRSRCPDAALPRSTLGSAVASNRVCGAGEQPAEDRGWSNCTPPSRTMPTRHGRPPCSPTPPATSPRAAASSSARWSRPCAISPRARVDRRDRRQRQARQRPDRRDHGRHDRADHRHRPSQRRRDAARPGDAAERRPRRVIHRGLGQPAPTSGSPRAGHGHLQAGWLRRRRAMRRARGGGRRPGAPGRDGRTTAVRPHPSCPASGAAPRRTGAC